MTSSLYPSPLTSPALATEVPKTAWAWLRSARQLAVVLSPLAEPW